MLEDVLRVLVTLSPQAELVLVIMVAVVGVLLVLLVLLALAACVTLFTKNSERRLVGYEVFLALLKALGRGDRR